MIAIDLHLDLAMNALYQNRDLRKTVPEMRLDEASMNQKGRQTNTVSYPAMHEGDLAVSSATLIARENPAGTSEIDYRAHHMAFASAMGQLAYYRQLESEGIIRIITDRAGLDGQIKAWETNGRDATPLGFIISMEGADPIVSPDQVPQWYDAGLRIASLVHYGVSRYAHGTGSPGGLKPLAKPMLQAMESQGMILDVTHMADQTFYEALEIYHGPLVATHNNCRALVPGDRQFTDEQIKIIVERGGVIGAAMDNWMLYPNYVRGVTPRHLATLSSVVDHIDHVCQLAGNARHVAIGTDLDGGYGTEQSPNDLDTIADLQKIPAILRGRGYAEADVEGVMHGNWLRFFREAWG